MNKRIHPALAALVVTVLLHLQPLAAFAADAFEIEVDANRVSIDARAAPLQPLLRELASKADFKLWMPAELGAEPVSLTLENQPLEKVLSRLLADTSYALVRGDDARLSAIFVLPRGESQSPLAATLTGNGSGLPQLLANPSTARIAERLNEAIGKLDNLEPGVAPQNPPAGAVQPAPVTIEDLSEALQQIQFKLQDLGQTPGAGADLH